MQFYHYIKKQTQNSLRIFQFAHKCMKLFDCKCKTKNKIIDSIGAPVSSVVLHFVLWNWKKTRIRTEYACRICKRSNWFQSCCAWKRRECCDTKSRVFYLINHKLIWMIFIWISFVWFMCVSSMSTSRVMRLPVSEYKCIYISVHARACIWLCMWLRLYQVVYLTVSQCLHVWRVIFRMCIAMLYLLVDFNYFEHDENDCMLWIINYKWIYRNVLVFDFVSIIWTSDHVFIVWGSYKIILNITFTAVKSI